MCALFSPLLLLLQQPPALSWAAILSRFNLQCCRPSYPSLLPHQTKPTLGPVPAQAPHAHCQVWFCPPMTLPALPCMTHRNMTCVLIDTYGGKRCPLVTLTSTREGGAVWHGMRVGVRVLCAFVHAQVPHRPSSAQYTRPRRFAAPRLRWGADAAPRAPCRTFAGASWAAADAHSAPALRQSVTLRTFGWPLQVLSAAPVWGSREAAWNRKAWARTWTWRPARRAPAMPRRGQSPRSPRASLES